MNVFMGYNPLVAKQVKVSVWVKEIDGAEPILPATPKDGDCFIVFDTDDDVLADNPSLKKSYANGSWGDAGGGGGGMVIPEITAVMNSDIPPLQNGTYTSTVSYDEMVQLIRNSSYQGDEGNMYPAYFAVTGAFIDFAGIKMGDGLIYIADWALHADGTITARDE